MWEGEAPAEPRIIGESARQEPRPPKLNGVDKFSKINPLCISPNLGGEGLGVPPPKIGGGQVGVESILTDLEIVPLPAYFPSLNFHQSCWNRRRSVKSTWPSRFKSPRSGVGVGVPMGVGVSVGEAVGVGEGVGDAVGV